MVKTITVCWIFAAALTAISTFVTHKAYGHDVLALIPAALFFLGGSMGIVHWAIRD